MSAPVRFRGVLATVPGRTSVPVRVPPELLAEAEMIAAQLGEDRAVVLGDLVAAALPGALAEAADGLIGAPARERLSLSGDFRHPPNAQRPAELAAGRASELAQNADGIVPPSARPRGDGATAAS